MWWSVGLLCTIVCKVLFWIWVVVYRKIMLMLRVFQRHFVERVVIVEVVV